MPLIPLEIPAGEDAESAFKELFKSDESEE